MKTVSPVLPQTKVVPPFGQAELPAKHRISGTIAFSKDLDRGALGVNGVFDSNGIRIFLIVRDPSKTFPSFGEQSNMLSRALESYSDPAERAKVVIDERVYRDVFGKEPQHK